MENAINCVTLFCKVGFSIMVFKKKNVSLKGYYPQVTQRRSSVSYIFIYFLTLTLNQEIII